jgi:hypothetical protein
MRYMMLIQHDEAALAAAPQKELWAEYGAFNEALRKAGVGMASGERLQPSSAATTVRVGGGKTDVLDGPYADTKEQFAGYFFVTVPDLDEAVQGERGQGGGRGLELNALHRPDPSKTGSCYHFATKSGRRGLPEDPVDGRDVALWEPGPVDIHRHLDRGVPHLLLHVGQGGPCSHE